MVKKTSLLFSSNSFGARKKLVNVKLFLPLVCGSVLFSSGWISPTSAETIPDTLTSPTDTLFSDGEFKAVEMVSEKRRRPKRPRQDKPGGGNTSPG